MSSPVYSEDYERARENVLQRDNFTCMHCGWDQSDSESKQIHTHHTLPRRLFDNPSLADRESNLVTLCSMCHGGWEKATRRLLKGKSEWWSEYREAVIERLSNDVEFLEEHFPEIHELVVDAACSEKDDAE